MIIPMNIESIRDWLSGRNLSHYKNMCFDYQGTIRQLQADVERLNQYIESDKRYVATIEATNDLLRAKIELMEAREVKPTKQRKRK
jgi:hypothetical protein